MTVIVDEEKRVKLPSARPGEKFDLHETQDGQVVLTPTEEFGGPADDRETVLINPPITAESQEKTGGRLIVVDGKHYIKLDQPLDMDALHEALKELP